MNNTLIENILQFLFIFIYNIKKGTRPFSFFTYLVKVIQDTRLN